MARIQALSQSVVNKIAAGEIIERPASVVKELLENSVDAGSTRIEVDVEQGGVELVRIVDDGCGIDPDDLPLAFATHATSKIRDADDLFQIATLGFRGEALASIGSVAQVSLQSRSIEGAQGAELACNGGDIGELRPWNGSPGTRIEVKHLFYNVPVRRKFLKTTTTEMGHVCEAFTRLSLSHPHLHLILRHNGKPVYEVLGGDKALSQEQQRDRLGVFFGREIRDALYPVDTDHVTIRLHGFIADPSQNRGNAKMQYVFVNGRHVRDRSIGHAIQEAYRGLVMTGRYAIVVLFLEMPPDQVDVNVHPTKAEVRFRNSQPIYHLVLSTIRDRLHKENLVAKLQSPPGGAVPFTPSPLPDLTREDLAPWMPPLRQSQSPPPNAPAPVASAFSATNDFTPNPSTPPPSWPSPQEIAQQPAHANVMQVHDSYLVMETPEGMLVIDQHALHERILFEDLKARLREGSLEVQPLLIPEPIELTAEQIAKTLEHREALKELGLSVEELGGGTLLLSSCPAILNKRAPLTVLRAVVDHLMSRDRAPSREVMLNDLLSMMACHAAVRAGDRLTSEAMSTLVAKRHLVDDAHHCPHGRPTALLFSRQELDRQFRRT